MEILRSEIDREATKRKSLEKEKKKFNAEMSQLLEDLNGMTVQRDELLDNKLALAREVEDLKEQIGSMKEMHQHELAAVKIQQSNSVKDLSIRVKEITEANQRLRRRTAAVENLLSKNAYESPFLLQSKKDFYIYKFKNKNIKYKSGSEDAAKTIQELELGLQQTQILLEQERHQNRELLAKIQVEETKTVQMFPSSLAFSFFCFSRHHFLMLFFFFFSNCAPLKVQT